MKKKIFFLIMLCAFFIGKNVYAEEARFYEAEYIPNIYTSMMSGTQRSTIRYQQARFFRQVGTGDPAYCIQPEESFYDSRVYSSTNKPSNLTEEEIKTIKEIGYFGYGYEGHTDPKWYAITQYIIWRETDHAGIYNFTNGLNGGVIYPYNNEIQEIFSLIYENREEPYITNFPSVAIEGQDLVLIDDNNIIKNYTTNIGKIEGNKLIIKNLTEGNHKIVLKRKNNTNRKVKFFESSTSQNMFISGGIDKEVTFDLKVIKTSIKINKVDSKTKSSDAVGKASVIGTKYQLLDKNNNVIDEFEIDENGTIEIKNINFDTYILKESEAGVGYQKDDKEYEITISEDNPEVELTLENDIIEKEINIHKSYGDKTFIGESNVIFNIYNENDEIVDKIVTDENGNAKLNLPYGKYTLKQVNTKDGYKKVDPIIINVEDTDTLFIELKDYKIKVPNTYTKRTLLDIILSLILLLC